MDLIKTEIRDTHKTEIRDRHNDKNVATGTKDRDGETGTLETEI